MLFQKFYLDLFLKHNAYVLKIELAEKERVTLLPRKERLILEKNPKFTRPISFNNDYIITSVEDSIIEF